MKILVALSGGIDSSVVAHLLKAQGHDLVAVRFLLWSDPLAPALAQILPTKCCTTQNAARAKAVAERLGIPYHIVDLTDEFKRAVVDPFLEEHRRGTTPNPCIGCNRKIKFGRLLELLEEYQCERLATGHYARIAMQQCAMCDVANRQSPIVQSPIVRHLLLEALDATKDQSYYLYGLSQEQLARVLFPLGTMRKAEVYAFARAFGVPFDDVSYRESQDLCFFPEKTPEAFLRRHLGSALRSGPIVRRDGAEVGTHEGLPLYTVGQRRGLRIGGLRVPLEVVEKDPSRNTLVVAECGTETIRSVELQELSWISWKPKQEEESRFECRTRSLAARRRGWLRQKAETAVFRFERPQSPIPAGQSLVFYRGEEVVGGGVIGG